MYFLNTGKANPRSGEERTKQMPVAIKKLFELDPLIKKFGNEFQSSRIEGDILGVLDIKTGFKQSSEGTYLAYLTEAKHLEKLESVRARVLILSENLTNSPLLHELVKSCTLFTTANMPLAMAKVNALFDHRLELLKGQTGISPLSSIHPEAKLGQGVSIGPFSIIGRGTEIGDHAIIGPSCVVEDYASIGEHTILESHVFVASQCRVGKSGILKPFACIGSAGYGFTLDPENKGVVRIPQLGNVILEDEVEIGSHSTIDRATIGETRVGHSTKIDNHVHIAHNCRVGKFCFITAGFRMAGSSSIGDFFKCGGVVAVGDHVQITDHVTLAGASVVSGHITEPGEYGGNPIEPMRDYLKTRSSLKHLVEMRKQLKALSKG